MRSHLLGHCSKHLASLVSREGFWLASELSQQTGALNGEHSSSQGGEENFLHSVGRAKDQESRVISHQDLALFLKLVDLAQSLPEIPYVHCPRLKSEST